MVTRDPWKISFNEGVTEIRKINEWGVRWLSDDLLLPFSISIVPQADRETKMPLLLAL